MDQSYARVNAPYTIRFRTRKVFEVQLYKYYFEYPDFRLAAAYA